MFPGTFARMWPEKLALVMEPSGQTRTYQQLEEISARLARVLYEGGLRRGDVIALLSPNAPEYFEVYWAARRSGLYITAVNWHLSAAEVGYLLEDSGARALIVSAQLGDLAREVTQEHGAGLELRYVFGGPLDGFADYAEAVGRSEPLPLDGGSAGSDMLYSSGTTGRPKGIRFPLPNRRVDEPGDTTLELWQRILGLTADDVYLSPAPSYHAAPLRWCGVFHSIGSTVIVMEKFDEVQFLDLVAKHDVSVTQVVPTMFVRMLKLPVEVRTAADLSRLRAVVHAAAPCPPKVKQDMIDWLGPIVYEYYGATESNGSTFIDSRDWSAHPGSVGRAFYGTPHVCDADGRELAPDEVGLLYFEQPSLPFEYHRDPDKTQEARHPHHPTWTAVGDLARIDDDGYVYLADRSSFLIISGGVNIYPREVEDVLLLHPAVYDAAVIGVPDDEFGQQVKAIVQPMPGVEPGPQLAADLIDFVRQRIAHFKAPRSVGFIAEMPRTPTGKLVKRRLSENDERLPNQAG